MKKINFIPPKYGMYTQIKQLLLLVIIVIVGYGVYLSIQIGTVNSGVSTTDLLINEVKGEISIIKEEQLLLEQELKETFLFNKLNGDFSNIPKFKMDNEFQHSNFLIYLGNIINPFVYINNLTFEGNNIILAGQGKDYIKILDFIKEIEEDEVVYNVNIQKIEPVIESDVILFELVCKIKDGAVASEDNSTVITTGTGQ